MTLDRKSFIIKVKISDHLPIFALASNYHDDKLKIKVQFRDFSEANQIKFHNKLSSVDWNTYLAEEDINDNTDKFMNLLNLSYKSCFPLKTKQLSQKKS